MNPSNIEALFIQKLSLVSGVEDCASYALHLELSQYDDVLDAEIQLIASALTAVARHVEADGAARFCEGLEPVYHNRQHIVEVVISTLMLLEAQQCKTQPHQFESKFCLDLKQRLLLIIAALGHDYLHDGGINKTADDAESLSANAVKAIMLEAGANALDAEHVHALIMATARANVIENHKIFSANPEALSADLLAKLLMSEADIFASLMPNYGVQSGRKLSEENLRAGVPNAAMIAMPEGRQWFLTNTFISSPHAKALGLDLLVKQQIR